MITFFHFILIFFFVFKAPIILNLRAIIMSCLRAQSKELRSESKILKTFARNQRFRELSSNLRFRVFDQNKPERDVKFRLGIEDS